MFNIKSLVFAVAFFIFLVLGILETVNSDPERYSEKIREEIRTLTLTLSYARCTERTRSANSLELVAKENGKSLFAYVGNYCKELESKLSVGDLLKVSAIYSRSEIFGIEKNGVTLLAIDSTITNRVRNYSNYNFVYFVLSLIFLMQLIVAYKNRIK